MRSKIARLIGILYLALPALAQSGEFKIGIFAIEIPSRYEGPTISSPDRRIQVYLFSVAPQGQEEMNALQIILQESTTAGYQATGAEKADVCRQLLSKMILSVERRRSAFKRTELEQMALDGLPAIEASWTGKLGELETNGTLFCVPSGPDMVLFHATGSGSSPSSDTRDAIRAIGLIRRSVNH